MNKIIGYFIAALGVVAFLVGISALFALPLMWLANWLFAGPFLVSIFGTAKLSFLQAWALAVICSYMFKSSSSSK